MKVYDIGNARAPNQLQGPSAKRGKEAEKSGMPRPDQVKFSTGLQKLMALEKEIMGPPEVRTDLVDRLQKQTDKGTYAPDSKQVADAMLSLLFEELA